MKGKSNKKAAEKEQKTYFTFASGWYKEEFSTLSCVADWKKNKKQNDWAKGTKLGYKMFVVPVDDTGEPQYDESLEVKYFSIKENQRTENTSEGAPTHRVITYLEQPND